MTSQSQPGGQGSTRFLKLLIFLMFAMFAMTTDSVGTIIPSVIEEFGLGMTAAGSFHYASMSGIGIAAILLGFLADRIGRKGTILLGLALFGATSATLIDHLDGVGFPDKAKKLLGTFQEFGLGERTTLGRGMRNMHEQSERGGLLARAPIERKVVEVVAEVTPGGTRCCTSRTRRAAC